MARADSNGSFLVKSTGVIDYIGSGGGDNQIVTYNPDNKSFENTDLENLFGGACVSQYVPSAPKKRPNGADLEIGDFWTNSETKLLSVWSDEEKWVFIKAINGTPVGTIIQSIRTGFFSLPPLGYLACDGSPCPPEYEELQDLLVANTGSTNLPDIVTPGFFIKT